MSKGSDLIFISQIKRDGSGVAPVSSKYRKFLKGETFNINRLSITQDTYIASGFNSFVVRLTAKAKKLKRNNF